MDRRWSGREAPQLSRDLADKGPPAVGGVRASSSGPQSDSISISWKSVEIQVSPRTDRFAL